MSELQSRLEPFLLLARTTKGAAAAKVVLDATAANGVYVFSQLLELPNIQELARDPAFEKHFRLLQLFAYGTLADYAAAPDSYPALTTAHTTKLKHLTLVSLALRSRSLAYADLLASLQVSSTSELENLVIDAMYADLLGGKMYHHEQMLHVDWVGGRDVSPEGLVKVKAGLETWCKNAETLLSALDQQIAAVREKTLRDAEDEAVYARERDEAFFEAMEKNKGKNVKGGDKPWQAYGGDMDLDDEDLDVPALMGDMAGMGGLGEGRISSQRSLDTEETAQRAKKRAKD